MLGNLFEGDEDDRAPYPAASAYAGSRSYSSSYHRKPMDKRTPNGFVGLLNQYVSTS
ncbi:hypothetical protein DFA_09215 [Cavenderia fasciculata]|uniref:Uncharacterized protein n=1 Tax=Cavenderia fasciculata TaxID=261658 RepID=F4Q705_CACFS|nr:uncharacterized protein DFA_09215 [Cavenderia fasciculata]EGG16187.1 hypothetical protein DFA_09215 [Cavenderia fasciculata]|eukprot:XP_004354571.1 hypothetical protein DFA_09215 [Cavenderia fasciculata]